MGYKRSGRLFYGALVLSILSLIIIPVAFAGQYIMDVTSYNPQDNANVSNVQPQFNYSASANISKINTSIIVWGQGEVADNGLTSNNTFTQISSSSNIPEGTYKWSAWADDNNDSVIETNELSNNKTITIDNTKPVSINGWNKNGWQQQSSATFFLNATDTSSGAANIGYRYYKQGSNPGSWTQISPNNTITINGPGNFTLEYNATDRADNIENTNTEFVALDNSPPQVTDQEYIGGKGFGKLKNDQDGYYSDLTGNNNLTLAVNFTDQGGIGVKNVTFDVNSVCEGLGSIEASSYSNEWRASCTVNVSKSWQNASIDMTVYDKLDQSNSSMTRNVSIYNFTTPNPPSAGGTPPFEFVDSLTTNLGNETNLSGVEYEIGMRVNGSQIIPSPWSGYKLAGHLKFDSLDFTNTSVQQDLSNLGSALDLDIYPKNNYNEDRIYVDTSAFAALNSNATLTLYNLPRYEVNASDIQSDGNAAGNVNFKFYNESSGTGNLTFSVDGFSGYNVTDTDDPVIDIHSPMNDTTNQSFFFNATFNGTGTEIKQSTVNLNITNTTDTYSYNLTDLGHCSQDGELLDCSFTPTLKNDDYNFTAYAEDWGGDNGNNQTVSGVNVTVNDTESPNINVVSPSDGDTVSGDIQIHAAITDTGSGVPEDNNGYLQAWYNITDSDGNQQVMKKLNDTYDTNNLDNADYDIGFNATDRADNLATNYGALSITVDNSGSGGSSGGSSGGGGGGSSGGGGGGGGTGTTTTETEFFFDLESGASLNVDVNNPTKFGVNNLNIQMTGSADQVKVSVNKQSGLPSDVTTDVSGTSYRYLDIEVTEANSSKIGDSEIEFEVNKSWIDENNIDNTSVTLNRYNDDEWQELETSLDSTNGGNPVYTATTPGFSYFAISGDEREDVENETEENASENNQTTITCGDNTCQEGENWESCSVDCSKPDEVVNAEEALEDANETIAKGEPGYQILQNGYKRFDNGNYSGAEQLANKALEENSSDSSFVWLLVLIPLVTIAAAAGGTYYIKDGEIDFDFDHDLGDLDISILDPRSLLGSGSSIDERILEIRDRLENENFIGLKREAVIDNLQVVQKHLDNNEYEEAERVMSQIEESVDRHSISGSADGHATDNE